MGAPLILAWNGTRWTRAKLPRLPRVATLESVSAVSASDVWAAGFSADIYSSKAQPLLLHWNGKSWTRDRTSVPAGQ
jgi:hypothetical protein